MWRDALRLLKQGIPLSVILDGRLLRLHQQGTSVVLSIQSGSLDEDRIEHRYGHPQLALLAYIDAVGQSHLLRAVGAARYAHLFPLDSSLSWAPVPLSTWRRLPDPSLDTLSS